LLPTSSFFARCRRPSGTRHRLAQVLGKARSFISQITNPTYTIAIPAQHLAAIFEVCHFSAPERKRFLEAYGAAHPRRTVPAGESSRLRVLHLLVPDLGSELDNHEIDQLIHDYVNSLVKVAATAGRRNKSKGSAS
jgi:hypothetical protein